MTGPTFKTAILLTILSASLIALGGCGEKSGPAPAPLRPETIARGAAEQKTPSYVHTVRWTGETLSVIAKWYTGKFSNWKAIAAANPELDPRKMKIGTRISIPEAVLIKQDALTEAFVSQFAASDEDAAAIETDNPSPPKEAIAPDNAPAQKTPPQPEKAQEPPTAKKFEPAKTPETSPAKITEPAFELFGPKDLD